MFPKKHLCLRGVFLVYNAGMKDFLAQFLGNPARARVLRILVSGGSGNAQELAKLASVSSATFKKEASELEKLKLMKRSKRPRTDAHQKGKTEEIWQLDTSSPYIRTLSALVKETSPSEYAHVEKVLKGSGRLSAVILSGIFMGDTSRPADLIIAWDSLNERRLERAVKGLEPFFGREIRYASFSTPEFRYRLTIQDRLLRDTLDFPHRILINRVGLLE